LTGTDKQTASTAQPDSARPIGGIGYPRTLGKVARGKNIHEDTLLATDYLNHFNEIVMLLDMVADIPECMEDAREWRPKSYADHFRDSCFQDKELAILAYENAPIRYRLPFDHLVTQMDATALAGLKAIEAAIAAGDEVRTKSTVSAVTGQLRQYIDLTSAIINGHNMTCEQDEIDALLASEDVDDLAALLKSS